MKFIVLLLIFGMNRYWVGTHPLYRTEAMTRVHGWLAGQEFISAQGAGARMALLLGLPVLAVLVLFRIVEGWLLGLVWIVGAVAVLGYSVDISRVGERLQQHLTWLKSIESGEEVANVTEYQRQFKRQMIFEEFEGLYPQVFWFLLVGPAGALLYRLAGHYASLDSEEDEGASVTHGDLIQILEWIPARVSGIAFAVVGNFSGTIGKWVGTLSDWRTPAVEILDDLATAAVADDDEAPGELTEFLLYGERQAIDVRDLLSRTLIFWLALIALLVLLGWS